MADIKRGDVVGLKSGGPRMTVQEVGDFATSGIRYREWCSMRLV